MNKLFFKLLIAVITFLQPVIATSQDTFSITAVDLATGYVGSAGASCIAGSIILSDVHPGRGVIHTQAYYLASNQGYARNLMNIGLSPQQIIDSVVLHDAQNNPTIRQYGITDNISGGRTAGYTGVNCTNYKNHMLGTTFTVQGNILLGQQILDSMFSRFMNTNGTFADKLMAALQGAKVPGADTRCLQWNKSTISAFIRVAKPTDPQFGPYWLDLNVNNTPTNKDPIDSLQVLYNNWVNTGISNNQNIFPETFTLYQNYPNPFNPSTIISFDIANRTNVKVSVFDIIGREVAIIVDNITFHQGRYTVEFNAADLPSGVYICKIQTDEFTDTKKMILLK
ncbi:MAG TPA: DUF1028 domain-containing protein [Ignavibacteria bacterium]|nr:DUF1028 domain-containing protein [Ignavibacteria bacterium]